MSTPPSLQVLVLLGPAAVPSAHSQRRSSFQVGDSLNPLRYRHQRTTTMLQAATNVPLALLASLASVALVDFRSSLFPLPLHAAKCLIFVQLDDHTAHELATPSALCFPPMDPPSSAAIARALAPLRRATRELQSLGAANTKDLAVVVYTANPHVPPQVSDAAMAFGAHALLTPPFTPPAVEKAMHEALDRRAAETTTSRNTLKADFQLRFQLPSMIMGSKVPPSPVGLELTTNPSPTTPSLVVTVNTPPPTASLVTPIPITPTILSSSGQPPEGQDANKPYDVETRRRSVDVGGLALATRSRLAAGYATGNGWGGWEECNERDIGYAELLSDMYSHTRIAVEMPLQHAPRSPSTPCAQRIPLKKRKKLIQLLNSWNFEPHKLPEDEILPATELVFESLLRIEGLEEELGVTLAQLCPFLHHVRQIYRSQNQYHNYIHALDVLQAVYSFLTKAGLVPPMSILWTERECKEEAVATEGEASTSPVSSPTSSHPIDVSSIPVPPIPITPPTIRPRTTSTGSASGRKTGRPRSAKGKIIRGSGAKEYKPPEVKRMWKRGEPVPDADGRKKLTDVLRNRDVFAICLAAIGHDIGHPGNSNAFMKNAQTPLSVLFDGKSALERMHCAIFLGLMKRYGMEHLLEPTSTGALTTGPGPASPTLFSTAPSDSAPAPTSPSPSAHRSSGFAGSPPPLGLRKLLVGTVLATDMSWHFEWIERFKGMQAKARGMDPTPTLAPKVEGKDVETASVSEEAEMTEEEAEEEQRLLICQALMKCADISNPARPHGASQYWSAALLEEWATQAMLEKQLELPISVVANADESMQANGQVTFIELFAQPLFDATASAIPEFQTFATMCRDNRQWWQERLTTLRAQPQETISAVPRESPLLPPLAQYVRTVFPMSLPPSFLPPSDMPQSMSLASGWFMAGAQPITPITPSNASSSGNDSPPSTSTFRPLPPLLLPPLPAAISLPALITPTSAAAVRPPPLPISRMTFPTPTTLMPLAASASPATAATTSTTGSAQDKETAAGIASATANYVPINYADVQSALRAAYRVSARPRVGHPSYPHHQHHPSLPSYDERRVPVDMRELVAS